MKKTLVTLLLFTAFVMPSVSTYGAVLLDRIVATVNGEIITWSELMNVIIIDGRQLLAGTEGQEREMKISQLERPFLNDLIAMKLQVQWASTMHLDVTPAEVDGAIEEIKSKFSLSEESLMESLIAEGLTVQEYRARLSDQILLQKVINTAVKDTLVVSDNEIEQYYNDRKHVYESGEKLHIRQIFFVMPGTPTEKAELEKNAADLVERVRQGEDFAELAKQFSEDPSARFGGDLGSVERGSILREIEEAALMLEPGETSLPVWSPAGLHIVQLVDRTGSQSLESVRDSIHDTLMKMKFQKKYHEWTSGLKEKAFIEIKL